MIKKKKFKVKALYIVISLVAVLGIGSIVAAYAINSNINVEGDYNNYEATQDIPEDFTVGAFPGPDVYEQMRFHGGMVKAPSFYASLNWSAGTTTAAGGETTVVSIAKMTNDTGKNLLCRDVWLDLSTARGIWGGDLAVGTTTATGDVSLTVTTTVSLIASNSVTTSSVDILNKEDDEGTDANVYWEFDANEVITVSDTFDTANATDTRSFLTAGGFTGVGAVGAECWYR